MGQHQQTEEILTKLATSAYGSALSRLTLIEQFARLTGWRLNDEDISCQRRLMARAAKRVAR